jgi:hypothetical protein
MEKDETDMILRRLHALEDVLGSLIDYAVEGGLLDEANATALTGRIYSAQAEEVPDEDPGAPPAPAS